MVDDASSAAVRAVCMYYAENDDRSQKNQQGCVSKLLHCISEAYNMFFAILFLFFFVGTGLAIASFTDNSIFCRDLCHVSQPEARNEENDKMMGLSLQKGEPAMTANDQ
ncbi:hypothetical protein O6H91_22G042500 [Diphasiastrum complanatum]|uniref:Uncharacterized protein n=1 Tax=Diphasiastrum complanatum TaxID=34168 RepID=A0ACC2AG56_DIPCM|nr:hypothetical protein O6H91_22G042500 [Diphasiastrum complanatum]